LVLSALISWPCSLPRSMKIWRSRHAWKKVYFKATVTWDSTPKKLAFESVTHVLASFKVKILHHNTIFGVEPQ
jgi:hypothetical protein